MIAAESQTRPRAPRVVAVLMFAAAAALLVGAAVRSQENMVTSGLTFLTMGVLCMRRCDRPFSAPFKVIAVALVTLGAVLTLLY